MEKSSFSEFQVKQMYEMLMDMLLRNPELFEQLPGVTAGQRKSYERMRADFLKRTEKKVEPHSTGL